jgi:hypothetical protein
MRVAAAFIVSLAVSLAATDSLRAADEIPRPEHPNPQFQRDAWQNLNGTWDFWEGDAADEKAMAERSEFPDKIVVPFCRESKLSGLGRTGFVKNVLYRRSFEVPEKWGVDGSATGARVLIHIGACDWRATVWLNGTKVGFHEGGSTPIDCDVTTALHAGANELRVWAYDDVKSGVQQLGKQCPEEKSYGCLYTRTTGIWQTVWMERVPATSIESVTVTAAMPSVPIRGRAEGDVAPHAFVLVTPRIRGVTTDSSLDGHVAFGVQVTRKATGLDVGAKDGIVVVSEAWGAASNDGLPISIEIDKPHPWSVEDPHLYDVEITLRRAFQGIPGGVWTLETLYPQVLDRVHSYVGLRSIATRGDAVLVNDKPVFQRLILDQGFYPDGIWTAPSDAALKRDIELSMAAGFNGARLHQKVFEPRFLYWADRLGYLVWGEAPSWGAKYENPACDRVVLDEWRAEVERDRNHPSLVGWCPFNETGTAPGKIQNAATALTRALDPTRPVLDTSGYIHSDPQRDVDDAHDYDQDPKSFRARYWPRAASLLPARYASQGRLPGVPFFVSEFGGIGWKKPGDPGWGYGNDPKSLDEWYARFEGLCAAQLENPTLFGFCYTQLTDVEQERNGLYYYDRTPKFDVAKLHAIVAKPAAIETGASDAPAAAPAAAPPTAAPDWRVVVPACVDDPQRSWIYSAREQPLADAEWREWTLEEATVKAGRPGFGKKEGFEERIGTPWTTHELYLMRLFQYDGAPFDQALLVLHYDNAVSICLNGETLFERGGWNDGYEPFDVTERAKQLLTKGQNTITVHVHQDSGGQYFDAALLVASVAR